MEHEDFRTALHGQITYWQKTLRLTDWTITADFWPHAALEGDVATIRWSRNQKTAVIAFRIPEDLPPIERDWPEGEVNDYDLTVVHELLHLKCIEMESTVEWAEEQLANHVSHALVALYRETNQSTDAPVDEAGAKPPGPVLGQAHGHYL